MEDQRAAAESIQDGLAAERFADQLRKLRTDVGNPSFRKMAGRSGRISHTTLHEAAAGTRFPSWETTREFVRACEADEVQWRRRWEDAQRPGPGHSVADGDLTPVSTDSSAAEHPQAAAEDEVTGARRHRLRWLAVVVAVAVVAVLGVTVRGLWSPDGSGAMAASPSSAGFSDALIPGDSSQFVADVTIPDGTRVKVNAHFVKVWALANVGSVAWHNRFLARMNPTGDDDGCQVPDRVAIGDTPPGEQVMISVPVTAPSRPGKCWVGWKIVDEHGRAYFPSRRPIFFMVTVTA
ncbi:NBR1-Ig-like domain-containing protein [Micromonospora sp. NPDC002296]|uniref:NBR1-Ig-like domain-containing protein n=1 Tax=Micromonospora sp. NPDC002296 TaxID=3154271 RepID=UPI003321DC12